MPTAIETQHVLNLNRQAISSNLKQTKFMIVSLYSEQYQNFLKLLRGIRKLIQKPAIKNAMRIGIVTITFLVITSAQILFAEPAKSQSIDKVEINLGLNNETLVQAFKKIENKSPFYFMYRHADVKKIRNLKVSTAKKSVEDFLKIILDNTSLTYRQLNNQILIIPVKNNFQYANSLSTLKYKKIEYVSPPNIVTGRVLNANGEALVGVSVTVKGATTGTSTDANGNYSIDVPADGTLVFSYVGFATREVKVNNRANIDVAMEASVSELNQVVVVGYGTQTKATLTGAVSSVSISSLKEAPVNNFSNTLAGKLSGVVAINNSGEPGGDGSTILIRGNHSLNNNGPLVVIDGVPNRGGGLERLDVNDIESVSVLKDATASIYGSQSANGVILITTKRGRKNLPPQFNLNFNQGFNQPTRIPEMADAPAYMAMINESAIYQGVATRFTQADIDAYKNPNRDLWLYPSTDWYKEGLKTWSPQSKANLSVQGGSSNVSYFLSLGAQTQEGYYKHSATKYNQYNFRSNIDVQVAKNIKLSLDLSGRNEDRNYPTVAASQTFRMLMRGRPSDPAYFPNGFPGPDQEGGVQPVVSGTTQTGYNHIQRYYLTGDVALDITIPGVKGFDLKGTFSFNKEFQDQKNWQKPWTLYNFDKQAYINNGSKNPTEFLDAAQRGPTDPRLTQTFYQQQKILSNLVANYKHDFGDHNISLMVGAEQQNFNQSDFNAFRRHFISTSLPELFAGGQQDWTNDGSAAHGARMSYFSRANYAYKDKYLLEFVGRYDGSYLFPSGKRFGFFPAFSGGWRITKEPFFEAVHFFDDLKLRASWGKTGNDITDPGSLVEAQQFLSGYQFGGGYVFGIDQVMPSIYQSREANPNATWERSNQTDIGIDATILNNRLSFTIDYWNELRSGILIQRNASVPQSTGLTLPRENLGQVRSWGYDGSVAWNQQVKKDLSFEARLTWGYADNKIVFWDEAPGAPDYQVSTNRKIGAGLYYKSIGVFQNQAEVDKYPHWTGARAGDLIFQDMNDDGKINADDRVRINKVHTPNWTGGIVLGSRWKQFSVSIFFQGAAGGVQYIATESGDIGNYLAQFADNRWLPDLNSPKGTEPSSERSHYSGPRTFNRGDTYWSPQGSADNTYFLRSTDYIRLKTLEIGYSIPKNLLKRWIGIQDFRIYANGYNLITWDKFKIMDPEISNAAGDYYPQARIFNFGFNLTF